MMRVALVGYTVFQNPGWYEWQTDAPNDAGKLIEFAGRMCYQSWDNPANRTNEQYIDNICNRQHFSVLEHVNVSVAIDGISRACSHELVRHRHFSFSQLSQRYVDIDKMDFVFPELLKEYDEALAALAFSKTVYKEIVSSLEPLEFPELTKTEKRKIIRQFARYVLPNATSTSLVMTGNLRAWAVFLKRRARLEADAEIRELAVKIWDEILRPYCPQVFKHFELREGVIGRRYLEPLIDFE